MSSLVAGWFGATRMTTDLATKFELPSKWKGGVLIGPAYGLENVKITHA